MDIQELKNVVWSLPDKIDWVTKEMLDEKYLKTDETLTKLDKLRCLLLDAFNLGLDIIVEESGDQ